MSARDHTLHADPDAEAPEGWERALLDARLEMLGRLADMGMELAAAIKDAATPEALAQPGAPAAVAMAFARVSRAVRMALALQSRLIQEFKTPPKAASAKGASAADAGPFEYRWIENEEVRRRRVGEIVRTLAEDSGLETETVERVAYEAGERLEQDEIYGGLMVRAVGDLVAEICRDLGLDPEAITTSGSLGRALDMSWDFEAQAAREADPQYEAVRKANALAKLRAKAPAFHGSS